MSDEERENRDEEINQNQQERNDAAANPDACTICDGNPDDYVAPPSTEQPQEAGLPIAQLARLAAQRLARTRAVKRLKKSAEKVLKGAGKARVGSCTPAGPLPGVCMPNRPPPTAPKAPPALRPPANNPISTQKQRGHVPGTPQYKQRIKDQKATSTFFREDQAVELTRRAWANGSPVRNQANKRDFEFGFPVGRGTRGGFQTKVRVHIDKKGRIHGHPVGREIKP